MKKLLSAFVLILTLCFCTACAEYVDGEYEVIAVAPYTVITGVDDNRPIEEIRIAFIYMDNGSPKLVSEYYESMSQLDYKNYIIVGDTNKYVVVNGKVLRTAYLYLTHETYNDIFGEVQEQ